MSVTRPFCLGLLHVLLPVLIYSCSQGTGSNKSTEAYRHSLQDSINEIELSLEPIKNDYVQLQVAMKESHLSNDLISQLVLNQKIGDIHLKSFRFDDAIKNHEDYLRLSEQLADSLQIVKALNLLASNYRKAYQLEHAIRHSFRARKILDNLQQSDSIIFKAKAETLNGIGWIYSMLDFPDEALNSFNQSYQYLEKNISDTELLADNLTGMGIAYSNKERYDSARVYFNKSSNFHIATNSRSGLGLIFLSFGKLSTKQGNYREALIFLNNAYNTLKETNDWIKQMEVCFASGEAYKKLEQYADAEKFLLEGLEIAKEMNLPFYLKTAYSELTDIYYLQNKPTVAQQHHIASLQYEGLIKREKMQNALFNAFTDYQRTESERLIAGVETIYVTKNIQHKFLIFSCFLIIVLLIAIFLIYNQYITNKKQNEKSLVEITKLKSDFYTNITHEFKTPISIIIGLAEKLKKTIGESKSAHNLIDLDIIGRQSENLLFLVNEILTVSKIQSSNQIHWVNGNIVSHLRYLHSCYQDVAEAKKINYLFHSSSDEIIMDYSREQIRVIVNNLLANSIKHCSAGNKILLMVREDKKQKKCIIEVADNGEGIAAKDLPHIFRTFYQGDTDLREKIGVGIGLAFTKQVVESLGGKIQVRSVPFNETVFTVEIPVTNYRKSASITPAEETAPVMRQSAYDPVESGESKGESGRPLLLIVEDNRDMVFYLTTILRDDYNIIVAHDGQRALEIAEEKVPDLIISDLMMPVMDGNSFCCHLKKSVMTSHIPIIVLTAKTSTEERIDLIKAGVDAYITKPFIEEELKAKISQLLKSRKDLREKYGQVVLESQNVSSDITNDSNFEFLQRVTDIIYREMRNIEFFPQGLASEMCISPSQLNRKIKSISGLNATNYILKVRLNRAKKLLTTSQKPIGEIAMDCGFNDFAYFSRTFKKEFGITPSKYQRMPHLQE